MKLLPRRYLIERAGPAVMISVFLKQLSARSRSRIEGLKILVSAVRFRPGTIRIDKSLGLVHGIVSGIPSILVSALLIYG